MIRTSPHSRTSGGLLLGSALALTLTACSGGTAGDGGNGDEGAAESSPTVSVGGVEESFSYSCITDPNNPDVLMIAAIGTDVDNLDASLGEGPEDDYVWVDIDDTYWEAGPVNGEITSLEVDVDASTATGEATFVNPDTGDSETGTFAFGCS